MAELVPLFAVYCLPWAVMPMAERVGSEKVSGRLLRGWWSFRLADLPNAVSDLAEVVAAGDRVEPAPELVYELRQRADGGWRMAAISDAAAVVEEVLAIDWAACRSRVKAERGPALDRRAEVVRAVGDMAAVDPHAVGVASRWVEARGRFWSEVIERSGTVLAGGAVE